MAAIESPEKVGLKPFHEFDEANEAVLNVVSVEGVAGGEGNRFGFSVHEASGDGDETPSRHPCETFDVNSCMAN